MGPSLFVYKVGRYSFFIPPLACSCVLLCFGLGCIGGCALLSGGV